VALATWAPRTQAFTLYTDCSGCHGPFSAAGYVSRADGTPWGASLHTGHQTMVSGFCNACHPPAFFPVALGSSAGGEGFEPLGCVGCHGRNEDAGNDSMPGGRGAGLRQHHVNSGISCVCHSDATPANYTPVGENVPPPYYFLPDPAHPSKPDDPCNANGSESAIAPPLGLDNDGDLLYDGGDPDCAAPVCGDGNLDAGEDCDDGNTDPGDCCAADCTFEPAGSACDDGLFCNGVEECDGAGSCNVPGTDPCDDGVGCTTDACDEGSDTCSNTPDDAACDDGQFCNGAETCDAVSDCQPGTPVDCDDGVLCTVDSCNEGTDSCDNTPDDVLCDDGQFCNGAETCDAVLDCQPGSDPCPGQLCDEASDSCVDCLIDGDCDDEAFCNGAEACVAGVCQAGTPVDCDDGVGCTVDACNEGTDSCDNTPDDAACDDGQFCNGVETCDAVSDCQPGTPVDCDDGVGCTVDACNEGTDSCDNMPDDALCDDGQFCNGVETCDAVSDCQPGTPPCDPATETCDEGTDTCEPIGCTSDADCDDGQFCNGAETCNLTSGECQPGTPVDCDDGVGCTVDACNEGTDSCDNTPDDALCDDGAFCNGAETCDAVNDCQPGTPVDCDDGVGCTVDSCNEGTDSCDNTPDDAVCDNGLFCDGAETCDPLDDCKSGAPVRCDDGDICTDDSCNEQTDQCDNVFDPTNDPSCVITNRPPVCDEAVADPSLLWPPNHKFRKVSILGVTDPDGDPVGITVLAIMQDEPVDDHGDGKTCPDGKGVGSHMAALRAERSGQGDGRVYHVHFLAEDGQGAACEGHVTVCVPHDQRDKDGDSDSENGSHVCGDQGPLFDSTGPCIGKDDGDSDSELKAKKKRKKKGRKNKKNQENDE
jgi:hypothetical protein